MKEYNYRLKSNQDVNIMDGEFESQLCCETFLFFLLYFLKIKQHRMMNADNGGTDDIEELF